MKHLAALALFVIVVSATAAENCKPIHDAPVTLAVSGKSGTLSVTASEMIVTGNEHSPTQPAELLNFVTGPFAFSLTPISSCQDGLLVEYQRAQAKRQVLVAWGQEATVDGKANTENYVLVTARRAKPSQGTYQN